MYVCLLVATSFTCVEGRCTGFAALIAFNRYGALVIICGTFVNTRGTSGRVLTATRPATNELSCLAVSARSHTSGIDVCWGQMCAMCDTKGAEAAEYE